MHKHSPWWKIISFIYFPLPNFFFLSLLYPYFLSSFLPYSFPISFMCPCCCHSSPCFFLPVFCTCLPYSLSLFPYPFYASFPFFPLLFHPLCLFYYCWMINTIGQMPTVITSFCIALCKAWAFSARCAVCWSEDVHETCFYVRVHSHRHTHTHTPIHTYIYM